MCTINTSTACKQVHKDQQLQFPYVTRYKHKRYVLNNTTEQDIPTNSYKAYCTVRRTAYKIHTNTEHEKRNWVHRLSLH